MADSQLILELLFLQRQGGYLLTVLLFFLMLVGTCCLRGDISKIYTLNPETYATLTLHPPFSQSMHSPYKWPISVISNRWFQVVNISKHMYVSL